MNNWYNWTNMNLSSTLAEEDLFSVFYLVDNVIGTLD